jgi:hypothetical protein
MRGFFIFIKSLMALVWLEKIQIHKPDIPSHLWLVLHAL